MAIIVNPDGIIINNGLTPFLFLAMVFESLSEELWL